MNGKKRMWLFIGAIALIVALAVGAVCLWQSPGNEKIDETLNLLSNASFEEVGADGVPAGWTEGKWYWDSGVSVLESSDVAYSGERSIMVYSAGENDARYTQTVSVVPDSYYRLSCMVRAEGCDPARNGAGISLEDTFASSPYAYDTDGEWTRLTLYGKTAPDQKEITVMARIGGYGSLNVGRAWFDDIELVRLKALPDGVGAVSFATNPPAKAEEEPEENGESGSPIGMILLACGLFALMMLAAMTVLRTTVKGGMARNVLFIGLSAAVLLRLYIATAVRGYEVDMNCFLGWSSRIMQHGISGFYNAGWCDYPPGYMLVLYLLGGLRALLGLDGDGPATWLLFKSVPMICDFLIGLLIWKAAGKKLGQWQATLLALLYLVNPATILNSAAWGQVDAVLTLLLVLAMYCAVRGRWIGSLSAYAVAVLMKPQALMFGPIGLLTVVCEVVWTARSGQDLKPKLKEMGMGILAMAGILLAVITPFALGQGVNPVSWAMKLYGSTLDSYPYITINACNLYALLGKNWVPMAEAGYLATLAWAMYALAFVYAFFLYIRSGKRSSLFAVCAVALSLIFAFGAKMHERYIYPAMAFLLVAYVVHRDARLLWSLLLLTVGQFINAALVLNYEHLQSSQALINNVASIFNMAGALLTAWTGWDLCVRGKIVSLPAAAMAPEPTVREAAVRQPRHTRIAPENWKLDMRRADYLIMAGITLVYSVVAFTNLGTMEAPETAWTSTLGGETVQFDLGETQEFQMTYYGGICNSSFTVSFSEDGATWTEPALAVYSQGEIFRWHWYVPSERNDEGKFVALESGHPLKTARYIRIAAEKAGLVLHEVGFLDANGKPLPIREVSGFGGDGDRANDPALLIDEQSAVPAYPSYLNSTYFDEIYHARTAYEHLHGMRPYETTHPPLGKVLIMIGIQIFGMTAFGWRFMGALFGCLMLPVMYLLTKQLLKKTRYATVATLLLALDCMHFTQTRIATIDTYGVFFIMLMYLFMFRYCQMNFFVDDFKKTLVPLGLCGVTMGLGIASKWICLYAAVGLAILFFCTLIRRYMEYRSAMNTRGRKPEEQKAQKDFWRYFCLTGAFCIVFFIIIPALIYYFSYYWYMKPMGGLSIKGVWDWQEYMLNYHSGLTNDDHFFKSPWYEWPLIVKPIWFYSGNKFMEEGMISSISCMGNPAVWWTGAAAMVFVLFRSRLFTAIACVLSRTFLRNRSLANRIREQWMDQPDRNYWYVALGFAAQYVPWMLVPRSMFIYHYFASVPFIILATMLAWQYLMKRGYRWSRYVMYGVIAAAVVLFVAFYPLMSGMPVARSYAMYLRWFNWYNF